MKRPIQYKVDKEANKTQGRYSIRYFFFLYSCISNSQDDF